MSVRPEVQTFVDAGPLPHEDADVEDIKQRQEQLEAISKPVTADEAALLVHTFGPDELYGIAWSLLHLIETAPESPVTEQPARDANSFVQQLWARHQNTGN